jgi:hypothetical protein
MDIRIVRGLGRYAWCLLLACGSEHSDGVVLEGSTGCERFTSLARAKGCELPQCDISPACDPQAVALVNCMATDLAQCICEADGDLNCEGAFKPNEGPAHCIAENLSFARCQEP